MKRQMIMLNGLNCPSCAAKLERAARNLPGMRNAMVSFGTGALNVEFDESELDQSRLREVIRSMGVEIATTVNRPPGGDKHA